MADLEQRVDKLEKRVNELEKNINNSLADIKNDLTEIKGCVTSNYDKDDLKLQLLEKDVKANDSRLKELESNQSKIVWTIIGEVLTLVGTAVIAYLKISS